MSAMAKGQRFIVVQKVFRVLVTGSQKWEHPASISDVLTHLTWWASVKVPATLVVKHGACPRGADDITSRWLRGYTGTWRVFEKRVPADWNAPCDFDCRHGPRRVRQDGSTYCQYAGMRRNIKMVDDGADLVLAFNRDNSSGTTQCVKRAVAAGLPVLTVTWPQRLRAVDRVKTFDLEALKPGMERALA